MALAIPPLSLYVHFPWCVRKCPYCDFNSYTLRDALPEERYIRALIADLQSQQPEAAGRPLVSVFLGGGTPSLFSPASIERVISAARATFGFADSIEVTLEANPGAVERGQFADYRAAGVNRVSLGAQSFDAEALKVLGRIHSPDETRRAAQELHAVGLRNFNLDLMYGLPGQTAAGACADLDEALALAPAHVSHYQLTLEAGTVFAAAPPLLPAEEEVAESLTACEERLAAAGFAQYEVSAYATEGARARHNLNYWSFGDYLGAGAGAHGKLTLAAGAGIVRTVHLREPRRYLADPVGSLTRKPTAPADLPFEFMLNALRLIEGFDAALFERRTGLRWTTVAATLEQLRELGLVSVSGQRWRPTRFGSRFLNEALLRFLPNAAPAGPEALSRPFEAQPRAGA